MAYKKTTNQKKNKTRKTYSASERKSYRKGFLAGLFASRKNEKVPRNKYGKSLNDYPNWAKHNVLFDDESYRSFYHGAQEMGFEHEKARDIALGIYSKECKDKKLKEHYDIK